MRAASPTSGPPTDGEAARKEMATTAVGCCGAAGGRVATGRGTAVNVGAVVLARLEPGLDDRAGVGLRATARAATAVARRGGDRRGWDGGVSNSDDEEKEEWLPLSSLPLPLPVQQPESEGPVVYDPVPESE